MLSSVNPNAFRFVPNRVFFLFWYQDSLKMELDLQLMFLRRRLPWLSADSHVNWFSFGKFWLERKPKRVFRLLTSDFQLQTSEFRLPASGFKLQTSDFRLTIAARSTTRVLMPKVQAQWKGRLYRSRHKREQLNLLLKKQLSTKPTRQPMRFAWRTETMVLPDHTVAITKQSKHC